MKIQQFLQHHGIASNPFADEDAQTDLVFKDHCIASTYHPSWDKVYGNPAEPATSIVLGEKGSGKTAMALQIVRHLTQHNASHPGTRLYVIQYDDFNPFLDRFADQLKGRKRQSSRVLAEWRLWDHMDAILSVAVTSLIDRILRARHPLGPESNRVEQADVQRLDRHQARDLLLLAACYDQSTAETFTARWHHLRKKLRFRSWPRTAWDIALGIVVPAVVLSVLIYGHHLDWIKTPWPYAIAGASWLPWLVRLCNRHRRARAIGRNVRTGNRDVPMLRKVLAHFTAGELGGQPLPTKRRTDDRYELLIKLQSLLESLGFSGIIVLVDRVDEPYLINGSPDLMRALVWSMLDNKFLKHSGVGLKLFLPIELSLYLERENRDFYQRARLDKQNLVPSLEWTGEALYDVAVARLRACASDGQSPTLRSLFDPSISDQRLLEALRSLRVPRHLFKFMYRLLVAHCNAHTDEDPEWHVPSSLFETTLAVFTRDQDAVDRGLRAG
ncbi:MAG: hypothetical protein A2W31_02665 [Planctomycetes bacterium RBG_16_64_10]|nr:MAG: hypothetical protein A2W31_02665 [Planctomycetes bacterium RBG_16_64_10]